jgi:hypothetical protein
MSGRDDLGLTEIRREPRTPRQVYAGAPWKRISDIWRIQASLPVPCLFPLTK